MYRHRAEHCHSASKRRWFFPLLTVLLFVATAALLYWNREHSNAVDNFDKKTETWFRTMAQKCPKGPPSVQALHKCSGWWNLTPQQFVEMTEASLSLLDPPLKDGESIADMGMGTGAPFAVMLRKFPNLTLTGTDLSEDAVAVAKQTFPKHAVNFFWGSMTVRDEVALPTNHFDHVTSFGALAMYLSVENMVIAMKEAVRATKPGGSLLFTHFWPPGSTMRGSIRSAVDASFWAPMADELGVTNVRAHCMMHQGDRYMVTMQKKRHAEDPAVNPDQTWPPPTTEPPTATLDPIAMFLKGQPILGCGVNNCRCAPHS